MVNLLLIPLAKIVINLVGKGKMKEIIDQGQDAICDFLQKNGFPKTICDTLANTIRKVVL